MISAVVGDMVMVLSRSPGHKFHSLADVEWMVVPPALAGQVYVAELVHKENGARAPVAFITWARVTDEINAHLASNVGKPVRLKPEDWTSGYHYWLIDLVGEPRALGNALNSLSLGPLRGKIVKVSTNEAGREPRIETLDGILTAATAIAAGRAASS